MNNTIKDKNMAIEILRLRNKPELMERAADWFHEKWSVSRNAYVESMTDCISGERAVPQWYLAMRNDEIIGGLGVIENDFHNRRDLTPNVCAVYVEKPFRCKGIAGMLLREVCRDMAVQGIDTLYLLTDHVGFYERYGWVFHCLAQGDGEDQPSRMYVHHSCDGPMPVYLSADDYRRTAWSGGTTTELAIHPDGAEYGERNFLWRISSASVDVKESAFTDLPAYERWICPLSGEMILSHNGGEEICLHPYEIHFFHGADRTLSRGLCTDFNLMLRRGASDGRMEHLRLGSEERSFAPLSEACEVLLYCAEGMCIVSSGDQRWLLKRGEALRFLRPVPIRLTGQGTAQLMICQMWTTA